MYLISKGCYLSFDLYSKEYIGIETYFICKNDTWISKAADNLINELLRKGILEYIED